MKLTKMRFVNNCVLTYFQEVYRAVFALIQKPLIDADVADPYVFCSDLAKAMHPQRRMIPILDELANLLTRNFSHAWSELLPSTPKIFSGGNL